MDTCKEMLVAIGSLDTFQELRFIQNEKWGAFVRATTFSITTLAPVTPSITTKTETPSTNDTKQGRTQNLASLGWVPLLLSVVFIIVLPSVVMLNVILPKVVASFRRSKEGEEGAIKT
jgi:hypothetical protein